MRPPLAALALALLLAGCTSGGNDGKTQGGGSSAPAFLAPIAIGQGGPEPVVAIADDSTIFVAAQDAGGGAPHFWASGDGGRTFAASSPSAQTGGEVDIATGSAAVVYFTQLNPSGGNVVTHSTDHGASWSAPIVGLVGTQYLAREWVALDGATPYLATLDAQPGSGGFRGVVLRSDDQGVTFQNVGTAWDADHEPGSTNGNLLAYAGGLALPYVCRDGNGVCVATSADRGASWTQRLVISRSVAVDNVYPIVAADGRRLVVVWSDASDGRLAAWAARSDDAGASWSPPARVSDAAGESATLAWIASAGGATWIAYASTATSLASADDAAAAQARWSVVAARIDSSTLAVQQRGAAIATPVHVGVISHPVGRGGQNGPFDRSFGDFFTIAVDARGKAVVAVVDTTQGAARDVLAIQP